MSSAVDRFDICCVAPHLIGPMWSHIGHRLLRGQLAVSLDMEKALLELNEHLQRVHMHHMQVWVVIDANKKEVLAALTTELVHEDGRLVLWVSRMSGDRILAWGRQLSDRMLEFAQAEGAVAVRCDGRKALLRAYGPDLKVVGSRGKHFGHDILIFERDARHG